MEVRLENKEPTTVHPTTERELEVKIVPSLYPPDFSSLFRLEFVSGWVSPKARGPSQGPGVQTVGIFIRD